MCEELVSMIEMNDQLDDSVGKDPLVRVRNRAVEVPNAFDVSARWAGRHSVCTHEPKGESIR
jgi:hypothetical protein